jgi:spore maturation protein CgeB
MRQGLQIAFFGSSLVSAYWNGAATYYRGIIKGLHELGHSVTFYEPDAYDRQKHRDIPDPDWATVAVYPATKEGVSKALEQASMADLIIKASGVGVFDEYLEKAVLDIKRPGAMAAFWDVDAPATLERVKENPGDPFRPLVEKYDLIFTYGGGEPVVAGYKELGARECWPIYNALDSATHFPVEPVERFRSDLGFLGNRMPDREARVREFFFNAAAGLPAKKFLLGGNGWESVSTANVKWVGHVYTRDHNAFNSTSLAVLNVNRASMAKYGFSPPTRIFEAAGAGACIITDEWEGIGMFLEPGSEVLVAKDGAEVAEHLKWLSKDRAAQIGRRAFKRIMAQHTYNHRAKELDKILSALARG